MKIKDIETVVVNAEMRNWVFVKVITDWDIYGRLASMDLWDTKLYNGAVISSSVTFINTCAFFVFYSKNLLSKGLLLDHTNDQKNSI